MSVVLSKYILTLLLFCFERQYCSGQLILASVLLLVKLSTSEGEINRALYSIIGFGLHRKKTLY